MTSLNTNFSPPPGFDIRNSKFILSISLEQYLVCDLNLESLKLNWIFGLK